MSTHNHTGHSHGVSNREEALILLKYMFNHNKEHTQELQEVIDCFDEKTAGLIKNAVECYEKGNELLGEALKEAEE